MNQQQLQALLGRIESEEFAFFYEVKENVGLRTLQCVANYKGSEASLNAPFLRCRERNDIVAFYASSHRGLEVIGDAELLMRRCLNGGLSIIDGVSA